MEPYHPDPTEFEALRAVSARIGADPLLVQGAGGNTSIKKEGVLWIKASGSWLANALDEDIMVPVDLAALLDAMERGDMSAEKAHDFVIPENGSALRPSIETTMHAVLPHRVVLHVHCVNTIAAAVQRDAPDQLEERLRGMGWAFVPYARPGLPLTRAILERLRPETDILVLGNHGLVVAADTVAAAERLLGRVCGLLAQVVRAAAEPDIAALARRSAGSAYRLPGDPRAHAVATDLVSCRIAAAGSLYPDHVIFLGAGVTIAGPDEMAAEVAAAASRGTGSAPVAMLFPGKGVLVRDDISAGAAAMLRCLSEVTSRIGEAARLRYLSDRNHAELLGWDAEQYRRRLDMRRPGSLR